MEVCECTSITMELPTLFMYKFINQATRLPLFLQSARSSLVPPNDLLNTVVMAYKVLLALRVTCECSFRAGWHFLAKSSAESLLHYGRGVLLLGLV